MRLEPYEGKLSRTVLRGVEGSNVLRLLDYASCETAFNPALRTRPVVVLSNNDGTIIARNPLAKKLGIAMGQPFYQVKRYIRSHNLAVLSSNYPLYGELSTRVMRILQQFAPVVELYSIDEAFIQVDSLEEAKTLARTLKETIFKWTHLPVSLGIAPNKTLAKVATYLAKRNEEYEGIFALNQANETTDVLKAYAVENLWGIGRRYAKKLHQQGVKTAYELTLVSDVWIRKQLTMQGLRMVDELRGEYRKPLQLYFKPKKTIVVAPSFGRPVSDLETMIHALKRIINRACEKLHHQDSAARMLTVFINTNHFRPDKPQYANSQTVALPYAYNTNPDLFRYARAILKQLYQPGFEYQKVGVMLSGIRPDTVQQLHLFAGTPPDPRRGQLYQAINRLHRKYGKELVRFASEIEVKPDWLTRHQFLSREYTTDWEQIPEAA